MEETRELIEDERIAVKCSGEINDILNKYGCGMTFEVRAVIVKSPNGQSKSDKEKDMTEENQTPEVETPAVEEVKEAEESKDADTDTSEAPKEEAAE